MSALLQRTLLRRTPRPAWMPAPNPAVVVLKAISLVCKVTRVNGRPAVKLSDNPAKATGDLKEIERYLRVFGDEARVEHEVVV